MNIFRNLPPAYRSILIVLVSYSIEVLNIIIGIFSVSMIFVNSIVPLNFMVAQFVVCFMYAFVCLFIHLILATSISKILLVTHFNKIFPMDPELIGSRILRIGLLLSFIPSVIYCSYQTYQEQMMISFVAYLTNSKEVSTPPVPHMAIYIVFWIILCILSMLVAVFGIPYYIQHYLSSTTLQVAEAQSILRKEINLKRILLSMVWLAIVSASILIVHHYKLGTAHQPQVYVAVASFNLVLTSFVLQPDVYNCIKRNLAARMPVLRGMMRGSSVNPTVIG
jgi:hypothetical protein